MSTLADLQKINIQKMEDADGGITSTSTLSSNEVSIKASKHQVNDVLHEGVSDDTNKALSASLNSHMKEGLPDPSNEVSIIPSVTPKRQPTQSKTSSGRSGSASAKSKPQARDRRSLTGRGTIREVLEAQVREHVLSQLLPPNEKGAVTRLNVEVPEDLHQLLKQHCVRTRTPIKGLINALIAWYLEAEE